MSFDTLSSGANEAREEVDACDVSESVDADPWGREGKWWQSLPLRWRVKLALLGAKTAQEEELLAAEASDS